MLQEMTGARALAVVSWPEVGELNIDQKAAVIIADTTPDLNEEIQHPRRRIRAVPVGPGAWRIVDSFENKFLSDEQLAALTVAEMLQEYATA